MKQIFKKSAFLILFISVAGSVFSHPFPHPELNVFEKFAHTFQSPSALVGFLFIGLVVFVFRKQLFIRH